MRLLGTNTNQNDITLKTGPMIGLLNVRKSRNGECWLDDDPSIEINYIDSGEAEQIANELRSAIEYIKSL